MISTVEPEILVEVFTFLYMYIIYLSVSCTNFSFLSFLSFLCFFSSGYIRASLCLDAGIDIVYFFIMIN